MKRFNAMKAIKSLGVLAVAACVFLGGAKVAYAEEDKTVVAVPPEGYELKVLDEMTVTENILPTEASKASGTYFDLSWSLANNTLTISGSGDMIDAGWSGNYPWATYAKEINKIVIGDYVTRIGVQAFGDMDNLKAVTIGSKVTTIGGLSFYDCDDLQSVTIPASVTFIDNSSFYGCDNLMEVNFAKGTKLTGIGVYAFRECKNLTEITLPDSLELIGEGAFQDCSGLLSVAFGTKLKTIHKHAFMECTQLMEVELPCSIRTIGEGAFNRCTNLVSVTIPDGVEEIKYGAFYGCENLTGEVKIPDSVTTLGDSVFYQCKKLQSALVYAACDIPAYAFKECLSLSSVTIGGTVTGIGEHAFYGNKQLESVTIPSGVTYIGDKAFSYCDKLAKVTLADNLTGIGGYAFESTAIASIKIPNTVSEIGEYAFWACESLTTATVGTGVTTIPYAMFYGCGALKSVTLGNGVNTIGDYAFADCENLADINWSTNLNTIGYCAFYNNNSLLKVELPDSVNVINERAFAYCKMLNTVVTMSNLKTIGDYAFVTCPSLNTFKTFSINTRYGLNVFANCPVTIYGFADSTAQTYAQDGHAFVAITELDTPVNKKIANVVTGAKVYWNAVPGASCYNVYRATTKGGDYKQIKSEVRGLNYLDATAVSGKTYYYKVEAKNGGAKSKLSAAQGITYVGTPDITSRINKAAGIQLGWNKITGATGYAIYRKSYSGNDAWVRVATISGNSTFTWTDESVKAKNGEAYKYTVRALAGSNMKTLSGCRNTGRTMVRLASRVMNSATKKDATSITCSWTTSSAVTGYEVRFMDGTKVVKTQTIGNYKTGTKTFTGLTKGKKYKVQVRSYKKVDGVGSFYSAWSVAKYVQL